MSIKLSICIPTYNRAKFLNEAIASVVEHADDQIEIVISDNASTDDTENVVRKWRKTIPNLSYFRWKKNMGADVNFLKAVELANGEYCWLLGSDDRIAEGALQQILPLLGRDDILLLDYMLMSYDMSKVLGPHKLLRSPPGTRFQISEAEYFRRYLLAVQEMSGLFAYISSIIVKKEAWRDVKTRTDFIGSAWIHATKVLDILRKGGVLLYVGKPLVLNRSENDSFLDEVGHARRILIDLDYVRIAREIFADDNVALDHFLVVLEKWFFSWRMIFGIRRRVLKAEGEDGLRSIESVLFVSFRDSPQYWLKRALWPLAPVWLLDVLHFADRAWRGMRRSSDVRAQ